ncbi:MAG: 3-hydroxyacyl-CoA dehydrogenase/enoyl-CoA hydratase family protein [Anaerolineaceae bacterium]|nr:3-hydroxyacyl-CoA dehydrogenase/enoyl-CoA hydratase family protein [Anaerolineaceae bacterium]MCY4021867.1 3-hydroxyacyl-CoA dehydrogenase/enoyl-CoA hydratase family protein [Anaerolineaceae bacterium]
MTYRKIHRVAVIGSGTMGGALAALLTGAGLETTLLDIPAAGTAAGSPATERNALARDNLQRSLGARPSPWFSASDIGRIRIGNLEDDLAWLAEVDWVLEAVVEDLATKRALMRRLQGVCRPDCVISTNTSGLPLAQIAAGTPADFTKRFLGTHFFNPPRWLPLLELIPHEDTDAKLLRFMGDFCSRGLGKDVVVCRDVPGFLGNRFLSMLGTQAIGLALDEGYSVAEVDLLTGPLIGRPRTATFGLQDLVGLDVAQAVARNLRDALTDSATRATPGHPGAVALHEQLIARGWLGRKSGRGFWMQRRGEGGQRERLELNLQTLAHEATQAPQFESVTAARSERDLGARLRRLLAAEDRAGQFLRRHMAFTLSFAASCVPEVTDSPLAVDQAQRQGFNHEAGPFELWDALGVAAGVSLCEAQNQAVASWVHDMLANDCPAFYRRDASGEAEACYDPQAGEYLPLPGDERALQATGLTVLRSNRSASLRDLGDGVALWEFHSVQNSIDDALIEGGHAALEEIAGGRYQALVIGNDGARFSIGYNLALALQRIEDGEFDALERSVKSLQELVRGLRQAPAPVVAAAQGMALGGGAELLFACDRIVAHSELLLGLVEFNVGLIPAGGGCTAMLQRWLIPLMRNCPDADATPLLKRLFTHLLDAEMLVAAAPETRERLLLRPVDRVLMKRAHLLYEAKRAALHLADGYRAPRLEAVYAAGRQVYEVLLGQVEGMVAAGDMSADDAQIARRLAFVLSGGATESPGWLDEGELHELERRAFMDLVREAHTQACIRHMLKTNRPLRFTGKG